MVCRNSAKNTNERSGVGPNAGSSHFGGGFFEIHIKGQLDSRWSEWFEGLEAKYLDDGEMILSGYIVDQAALFGTLNKVNRLNLTLLSVSEIRQEE